MATPRIFVSHSHQDNTFGFQLVADLRAAIGADEDTVWYDARGGLHGGDAWWRTIEAEITARPVFIVVLSPDAVASPWVNDEIDLAWRQKNTPTGKLIIPLLLRPCDVRPSLQTLHITSFVAPRPYTDALAELLATLKLPPSTSPPLKPSPPLVVPARPSRLSRRQVLVGSGVATGLVVVGGVAWLARPGQGSGTSVTLPTSLAPLGFVLNTKGSTKYIVPPLVSVPAGAFLMGSNSAKDPEAAPGEEPQSSLTLGAFQIAKYPVTVVEYAAFVQQTGHSAPPSDANPTWTSQQQTPDHPIVSVSWYDAKAYAAWLAQLTGQPWRLPTEAEWEKAARGTDGRVYPWGNQWDKTRANTSDSGPGATTLVGRYPSGASPYGAQDIAGNVWEWCSSLFKPYPYSQSDGRENQDSSENRVLRGGSWDDDPRFARVAFRSPGGPAGVYVNLGFRLVLAAPGSV